MSIEKEERLRISEESCAFYYWKQLPHLFFLQFCIIFIIFPVLQLQYLKQEQTGCFPEAFTVQFNLFFFSFLTLQGKEKKMEKKPLKCQHYLREKEQAFTVFD